MRYYSKTTGGFYDSSVHAEAAIPEDAVVISEEQWQGLLLAQTQGKVIRGDAAGFPQASEHIPSIEELAQIAVSAAKQALVDSDTVFIRCGKAGVPWPNEWQQYVEALRAIVGGISTATELPTRPQYPAGS